MTTRSQISVVEPQEPLSVIGQRIRSSFGALEYQISQCQGQDALAITLQDVSQRYNLWAVNLGLFTAGHSSLEYRLGDAPLIYDYTRNALADLEKYLNNAIQALQETHEDKPLSSVVIKQATNLDRPDVAQAAISDDSEDEDFETYDDDSVATTALENASGIIDGLYRLSFKIRNPATRTGFSKAQNYQEIDDETGVNLIKVLADFDRQHVEQVFIQLRENRTAASPAASEYESNDHKERDEDEDNEDDEDDEDNGDDEDDDHGEKNEEDEVDEDDDDDGYDGDGGRNEEDEEEDEEDEDNRMDEHHQNTIEENEEGDSAFKMSESKLQKHYLVKRLAKANTRRRQQFKHWQNHRNKVEANSRQAKDFAPWLSNLRAPNTGQKEMLKVAPIPNQPAPSIPSTVTRVDPAKVDLDDTSTHLEMIGLDSTQRDQRRTCPICLEDHVTDEHVGIHLQQIALFALPRSTGLEGDSHVDDDASAAAVDDLERDRKDGSETRSFSDEGEPPPEAVYGIDYQYVGNMLADLDLYQLAPDRRQIEDDWSVFLMSNGTLVFTLAGHTSRVYSINFLPDSSGLLSGSSDSTVRLWNVEAVSEALNLTATDYVFSVAVSADSQLLAAGLSDSTAIIWNRQGTLIATLSGPEGHCGFISSIAFAPQNHEVVTASWDKTLKVWDLQDIAKPLVPRRTFTGHKVSVQGIVVYCELSLLRISSNLPLLPETHDGLSAVRKIMVFSFGIQSQAKPYLE
ncbi:MAG: hypothetical protein Q9210_000668 [Variospora velana]